MKVRTSQLRLKLHLRQGSQVDLVAAAQRQVDQALQPAEDLEAVGHQQRAVAATQQTLSGGGASELSNARGGTPSYLRSKT